MFTYKVCLFNLKKYAVVRMIRFTVSNIWRKSSLINNIKYNFKKLNKIVGFPVKIKSELNMEEIPAKKIKLTDVNHETRTVATMCGAWRPEEDEGGLNLVLKIRQPCLSPDPERECDYPENIEDFWLATFPGDNDEGEKKNGEDCVPSNERKKSDDAFINNDLKKAKKALKTKRPGFNDDRYGETSYYFENGLRKVYPYYFTFTTFTKGRWVGDKILDVFAREFRAAPASEYERCIKAGTLSVNHEKVDTDYRLKHNDLLANVVHRHEVPVTNQPIALLHIDEDIVVINKPASIPVHPCGRYRHNTVVFILAKEYNLKNLRTIHRLDRLTSGLLMFGRNQKKARLMEDQIRKRQVEKEYVCRVDGEFPEEEIESQEPIEVVSYKIGVCKVSPKGKYCSTIFKRLGYNAKNNTSVVLCRPKTGRMHQIRVHLQYLGYPIVNDPLYNHPVFGPLRGKGGDTGGKSDEELIKELISLHNAENWLGVDVGDDFMFTKPVSDDKVSNDECVSEPTIKESSPRLEAPASELTPSIKETPSSARPISGSEAPSETSQTSNNGSNESKCKNTSVSTQTGCGARTGKIEIPVDPNCYECTVKYRDPRPSDLIMYLHAWRYKGIDWGYETELPQWADVGWQETERSQINIVPETV